MNASEQEISRHMQDALTWLFGDTYIEAWEKKDMCTSKLKHIFRRKIRIRYDLSVSDYARLEAIVMRRNTKISPKDVIVSCCRATAADSTSQALVHDAIKHTSTLIIY